MSTHNQPMVRPNRGTLHCLTGVFVAVALLLAGSGVARAQYVEAALAAKKGFDYAKAAYEAYKAGRDFLGSDPSTAELVASAVDTIKNLVAGTTAATYAANADDAVFTFRDAENSTAPSSLFQQFDTKAQFTLLSIAAQIPNDPRLAHSLGCVYNDLLALYIGNHLSAHSWGSTISDAQLLADVLQVERAALQLNYDMVGAGQTSLGNTIPHGYLWNWVNMTSSGPIGGTPGLFNVYFQTDPVVQCVQRGAARLVDLLSAQNIPVQLLDKVSGSSVTVNLNSWTNNWRGHSDGVWTSAQQWIDGIQQPTFPCPRDTSMVSVWQTTYAMGSYLCVPVPASLQARNPATATWVYSIVNYSCSGSFCGYKTLCPTTDVASSASMGRMQCVHRNDDPTPAHSGILSTVTPTRIDQYFPGLTDYGTQFDLPSGTSLVGIDPSGYASNNFSYYVAALDNPIRGVPPGQNSLALIVRRLYQ